MELLWVFHVIRFLPYECLALVRKCESCKQEALDGIGEVAVLGLFAVFVHDISDNVKVHVLLNDEFIVLGIPVGKKYHHGVVVEFVVAYLVHCLSESVGEEICDDLVHLSLSQ